MSISQPIGDFTVQEIYNEMANSPLFPNFSSAKKLNLISRTSQVVRNYYAGKSNDPYTGDTLDGLDEFATSQSGNKSYLWSNYNRNIPNTLNGSETLYVTQGGLYSSAVDTIGRLRIGAGKLSKLVANIYYEDISGGTVGTTIRITTYKSGVATPQTVDVVLSPATNYYSGVAVQEVEFSGTDYFFATLQNLTANTVRVNVMLVWVKELFS